MTMKRLLCWLIVCGFVTALLPGTPVRAQATEILKSTAHTFSGEGKDC